MIKKITNSIMIMILCFSAFGLTANAAESIGQVDGYQEVIQQINEEYGTSFVIDDETAFISNIVAKMSAEDFRVLLSKDAEQLKAGGEQPEVIVEEDDEQSATNPKTRISSYQERKVVSVTQGSRTGKLSAVFEIVDLTTHKAFSKVLSTGTLTVTQGWYFKAVNKSVVSFSSSSCKISYKGSWTNAPSGLSELTTYTYTVTYKP